MTLQLGMQVEKPFKIGSDATAAEVGFNVWAALPLKPRL
jgi:hypothetical protein